jgi:hypothetical protein
MSAAIAHVLPLASRRSHAPRLDTQVPVAVFVTPASAASPAEIGTVARLFNLTPAEARLLTQLLSGASISEAAAAHLAWRKQPRGRIAITSCAVDIPDKDTTPYVTHFVFPPVQCIEVSGLGTATLLEAVGTTENMKGEKMLDKMSARCSALSVDLGPKKYIDGACVLADSDGDMIFSTFDTRDIDKSQPELDCGTHIITGRTGKYAVHNDAQPRRR